MRRLVHAGEQSSGGWSVNVFSNDELWEIHLATLEVMGKTGLFVEGEEAINILDGGGALVDRKKRIVKFPPYLIEDAICSAPRKLVLAGRNPKNDIVIENNRVGFANFASGIYVNDLNSGELRETLKSDVADSALLTDYLTHIDVYAKCVDAHDVPPEVAQLHHAEAFIPNTSKHCFIGPGNGKQLRRLIEMFEAVAGGKSLLQERPLISFVTCPTSPLRFSPETCEIIVETARSGMVLNIISMAMSGGSAPVTLAGTLVSHNAEVLGGIVLSQLTRKGAPVIYGSSSTIMDLRLGTSPVGCPEMGMISAAVAVLARFYSLPSWVGGA